MNNYMEDEQIIDFIKHYIDKTSYNYAVLIDGGWGCGKTYFVEKHLISSLKDYEELKHELKEKYKQKKIIYISLYGIGSREELDKRIFIETIPMGTVFKSKGFKIASNLGKTIIGGALSYAGISLDDNNFDVSNIVSLENCILIFDDLERCDMNVNEVLGYINNFVEHDGIKVIIIANEKEISTSKIATNRELKYLVASNKNILSNHSLPPSTGEVTTRELDKRVNLLFRDDELYKLIKEKLIGVTIFYRPEITKILDSIEKDNTNIISKEIILNNKKFILNQFEHYEHHNIRTLLFGLDKFNDLLIILEKEAEVFECIEVLNEIFKYIIKVSILYKSGRKIYEWEEDKEIDTIDLVGDRNINDYIKGFKFIDNFILGAVFDKEKALNVIKREKEILKLKITDTMDPLYILEEKWFLMNDVDVAKLINNVNLTLEKDPGKYHTVHYSKILMHNITLSRLGVINNTVENVLEIMKSNIEKLNIKHTFDTFGYARYIENEKDALKYTKCIKELNNKTKLYQEERDNNTLIDIINNIDNWADKLYKYAVINANQIIEKKAFLSILEYDKLINAIKSSTSMQIFTFRQTILNVVYKFSNINEFYKSDMGIIVEVINELNRYYCEIKSKEIIKANNIEYLINDLNNILRKLKE